MRLRRSPELTGRVRYYLGDNLMVTPGGRGLTGLFNADQLELVPGQEEVLEA